MESTSSTLEGNYDLAECNGPSADFICAISEFLDTDPKDILVELGYYRSEEPPKAPVQER